MLKHDLLKIKRRRKLCQKAVQQTVKFKRMQGEYDRFKDFLKDTKMSKMRINSKIIEKFLAWRSIKAGKTEEESWLGLESLRRIRNIMVEILEQLNYEPNPAKAKSLG